MLKPFSFSWCRCLVAIALTVGSWAALPGLVWAQLSPVLVEQFLADPEFSEPRDPLLPDLPIERPLSPLEKLALESELDQLALAAEALYLDGQTAAAIDTWMREVRLRRILGYEAELEAIQRVGLRVWEESQADEVQLITLRLRQIQADLLSQEPPNEALLEEVVNAFEVLRDVDAAEAVYETLIVRATARGDRAEQQRLLANLANLREIWFRFETAVQTYLTLLDLVEISDFEEIEYLQGVIRNYQELENLPAAIAYQRRLVRKYEQTARPQPIPSLTLAIARNYQTLGDVAQAQPIYSTTYSIALAQGQTQIASEALQDLSELYKASDRPTDVLYLYQQRLAVERLSYSGYGLMQTFENLGQLYEAQNLPDNAIAAYKEALIIAEHLNYRDSYFKLRLQQLLFEQGQLEVVPLEQHLANPVGNLRDPNRWLGNGPS